MIRKKPAVRDDEEDVVEDSAAEEESDDSISKEEDVVVEERAADVVGTSPSHSIARYDPLQAYLSEIRRYELLSPQREHEIAVQYLESGDVSAAAKLVTANLRLVVKIAYEYRRAYRNILDLIQEGNIGLMQAVKKYDPYRGVKLSSYAAWWIRAYILRFILNNWRMVKIGTTQTQRKLFFNLSREQARLAAMGIEPTAEKVAVRLGVEEKEIEEMDKRMRATDLSLDAPVSDPSEGGGTSRVELTPSPDERADDALAVHQFNSDLSVHLASFGATLEGREKYIFEKRLMTESPMTLQDIGNEFGLSRERVRQIERRLLNKLRAHLLENMGEHFDIYQEQ
jgi:RNA polymerase sigma-32 factor